jgi:large subunit ribosomal protein L23
MSSKERLMQVLVAPHVSEKGARVAEQGNQIVFRVARDATKPEIKAAVELMFEVKVDAVQVVNVAGKAKRFGGRAGRRSDWKKAYVKLAQGQTIDFAGAEK